MDRGAWRASVHGVRRVGQNVVTNPPPRDPEGRDQVTLAHGVSPVSRTSLGGGHSVSVETMKGSLEKVIRLNRLKTKYG